jgi:hypothetical protein
MTSVEQQATRICERGSMSYCDLSTEREPLNASLIRQVERYIGH